MNVRIQHPDGSTQSIVLNRAEPAYFGRDERCTVRLADPTVHPVHFRITFEGGAWVLDVAKGAPPISVNGQQSSNAILRPGDVIEVGGTRIDFGGQTPQPAVAPQQPAQPVDVPPVAPSVPEPRPAVSRTAPPAPPTPSIWKSPLILGSAAALIVLIVVGVWLYSWYYGRTSEALFDQAQTAMQEGRSLYARKLFQRFLDEYPDHELANLALIYRELCDVQAALNDGNLIRARDEIQDLFDRTNKLPELQGVLDDVAQTILRVGTSAAEVAQTTGKRTDFELARDLRRMFDQYIPEEKQDPEALKEFDRLLDRAEAAVVKQEKYTDTIAQMTKAIDDADTETAYRARDALVAVYPDLEKDDKIVELMQKAAQVDVDRCAWQKVDLRPERTDRSRPSHYLVPVDAPASEKPVGSVGYAVARGAIYGMAGGTGAPLWRRFVGFDAVRLPVSVPSSLGPRVAVLDTAHRELVLLAPDTGMVQWRLRFQDGLFAAPLYHRGKLYLPTLSGNLYRIDAGSGRVDGRLYLGDQELILTPVASRAGRHLYVVGEHSNLYVVEIRPDGLRTVAVYYTGHLEKTVLASPLRMDRYIVLCENRKPGECVLRVLLVGEDETSIEDLRQDITLPGWVLSTPASYSNLIYVATDRDTVHVFSAGAPEAREGLKKVTEARPASTSGPTGHAYVTFVGEEDLIVVGSTVRHYKFSAERQILRPTEQLERIDGTPLQAPVKLGDDRFLIVWQPNREPEVRATLVKFSDGGFQVVWEHRLALGFLSLDRVERQGRERYYLTTAAGLVFELPATIGAVGEDRFLVKPVCRIEHDPVELRVARRVTLPSGGIVYVSPQSASQLLIRDDPASSQVRTLRLVAPAQLLPVPFADGLLIAAEDSRLYLVEPTSGEELAQPFQPPVEAEQGVTWTAVAVLADAQVLATDSLGRAFVVELRREEANGESVRYLAARAESTLPRPAAPQGRMVVNGDTVVYQDREGKVTIARLGDFSEIGRVDVGDIEAGPVSVGGIVVVAGADGAVVAIEPTGQVRWRCRMAAAPVAEPTVTGDQLLWTCSDAVVRAISTLSGEITMERRIEEPLAGPALRIGNRLTCFGVDGTVHVLSAE